MGPWISPERGGSCIWNLSKVSRYIHSNPVLFPPIKPPDPVKDIYDGHTYDLKTRLDKFMRVDVAPMQYVKMVQTFHLKMWFFWFITGITFK